MGPRLGACGKNILRFALQLSVTEGRNSCSVGLHHFAWMKNLPRFALQLSLRVETLALWARVSAYDESQRRISWSLYMTGSVYDESQRRFSWSLYMTVNLTMTVNGELAGPNI